MTDSHSRLDQFLLLARSTKGAAAAKIVLDVTAASGVYVFSEIMDLPNIKALKNDAAFVKYDRLLTLFAYGRLGDYSAAPEDFPPLTRAHIVKLKHLSLISLASEQRILAYNHLMESLQIDSIRELEDLIIDVIYADLLTGKMHHQEQVFHVDWVAGRDVSNDDLKRVRHLLGNWCKNAETLLSALESEILDVRRQDAGNAEETAEFNRKQIEAFLSVRNENALVGQVSNRRGTKLNGLSGGMSNLAAVARDVEMQARAGQIDSGSSLYDARGASGARGESAVRGGRMIDQPGTSDHPDDIASMRAAKRAKD